MLTDVQWAMLAAGGTMPSQGQDAAEDLRRTFEAILWRYENGAE
jgi:hypothetical protein